MFKRILLIAMAALSITSSAATGCSGGCGSTMLEGVPALPFDGCYEEDFQLILQSQTKTSIESDMTNTITVMFG